MQIVSTITKSDNTITHTLTLNNEALAEFVFTEATSRVVATPITQPVTFDIATGIAGLKAMQEFSNLVQSNFEIVKSHVNPHTLDISYKANGVDNKLKFGNVIAYDATYKPDTQEIKFRRDALDINWSDWRFWLENAENFFYQIELHKQGF